MIIPGEGWLQKHTVSSLCEAWVRLFSFLRARALRSRALIFQWVDISVKVHSTSMCLEGSVWGGKALQWWCGCTEPSCTIVLLHTTRRCLYSSLTNRQTSSSLRASRSNPCVIKTGFWLEWYLTQPMRLPCHGVCMFAKSHWSPICAHRVASPQRAAEEKAEAKFSETRPIIGNGSSGFFVVQNSIVDSQHCHPATRKPWHEVFLEVKKTFARPATAVIVWMTQSGCEREYLNPLPALTNHCQSRAAQKRSHLCRIWRE